MNRFVWIGLVAIVSTSLIGCGNKKNANLTPREKELIETGNDPSRMSQPQGKNAATSNKKQTKIVNDQDFASYGLALYPNSVAADKASYETDANDYEEYTYELESEDGDEKVIDFYSQQFDKPDVQSAGATTFIIGNIDEERMAFIEVTKAEAGSSIRVRIMKGKQQ
ncbi:MAG: hypothetical protein KDC26_08725 [Armatimonadetes bacterium]|nr:hypothetical protein [Armatimonadota bacterium]